MVVRMCTRRVRFVSQEFDELVTTTAAMMATTTMMMMMMMMMITMMIKCEKFKRTSNLFLAARIR